MPFNSLIFAIFLPIVFFLYWVIPHRLRWLILLVSSYYFYMSWDIKYVIVILFTTVISYSSAILLEKSDRKNKRKILLISTLITILTILFFFKYISFTYSTIIHFLDAISINVHPITLKIMMPIGISFYTFQILSYVIDVYKGEVPAEKHFGKYATFISFFPQIVSGPIARTKNLLPQIKEIHQFEYYKATYGLKLMAWGFFKKVVIADLLATYVDKIYSGLPAYKGFALLLVVVFFTFQIYCDFSGYSDIAIGIAKLFGINLMDNFRSPYFSASVKEFWSRWHISLSTWFRDYIYIPLGGNRVGKPRYVINILVTFIISGLWHGANWTYLIWGGIHGFAQVMEMNIIKVNKNRKSKLRWIFTVCIIFVFINFTWIFFRADTIKDAIYVIQNMFYGISSPFQYINDGLANLGIRKKELLMILFYIFVLLGYDFISLKTNVIKYISELSIIKRWLIYCIFIFIIILFSQKGIAAEFVYFQF